MATSAGSNSFLIASSASIVSAPPHDTNSTHVGGLCQPSNEWISNEIATFTQTGPCRQRCNGGGLAPVGGLDAQLIVQQDQEDNVVQAHRQGHRTETAWPSDRTCARS